LLVDLPGYGFAKVPEEVKKGWGLMVEAYFRERKTLRLVVFLLDIRRMQVSDNDLAMIRWFEYYRIPYLLALTKIDKVSKQQVIKHRQNILDMMEKPAVADVLFSARTGAGRERIWEEIEKFIFDAGNNA
jgi:GTP-binding protein